MMGPGRIAVFAFVLAWAALPAEATPITDPGTVSINGRSLTLDFTQILTLGAFDSLAFSTSVLDVTVTAGMFRGTLTDNVVSVNPGAVGLGVQQGTAAAPVGNPKVTDRGFGDGAANETVFFSLSSALSWRFTGATLFDGPGASRTRPPSRRHRPAGRRYS